MTKSFIIVFSIFLKIRKSLDGFSISEQKIPFIINVSVFPCSFFFCLTSIAFHYNRRNFKSINLLMIFTIIGENFRLGGGDGGFFVGVIGGFCIFSFIKKIAISTSIWGFFKEINDSRLRIIKNGSRFDCFSTPLIMSRFTFIPLDNNIWSEGRIRNCGKGLDISDGFLEINGRHNTELLSN